MADEMTYLGLRYRLAVCRLALRKPEEALALFRHIGDRLAAKTTFPYQQCYVASVQGWAGQCLTALSRYEEAEPLLLASHEWILAHSPEQADLRTATQRLVDLYGAWGHGLERERWAGRLLGDAAPEPEPARNLTFEEGVEGEAPAGWSGAGAAFSRESPAQGAACARLKSPGAAGGRTMMTQTFSAAPYRGRRVRISASMRVDGAGEEAWAQFYIHTESKELDGSSFLDNSTDRPCRSAQWGMTASTCAIGHDTARICVGVIAFGGATAWLDDVRIEVIEPGATPPE